MEKRALLEKAAHLRDEAQRQLQIADGLSLQGDRTLFIKYAAELREEAIALERQAAAQTERRPAEENLGDQRLNRQNQAKGRGGSNDPDPQV